MHALLATRLKNKRKELGWSQKELAEGICQQTQIFRRNFERVFRLVCFQEIV